MKVMIKLLLFVITITRVTLGIQFIEPIIENPNLVGAAVVATAGLAAGVVQQKLTTYYAFKEIDRESDVSILDAASQQFLQEFRRKNKGIISIDILLPSLSSGSASFLPPTIGINYPLPTNVSTQPTYILTEVGQESIGQASSSASLNNQQGSRFALTVNPDSNILPAHLTNVQLDSLRIAAEHLSQSEARANRAVIRREVKSYLSDFTPATCFEERAQEAYAGAVRERAREQQKDLDIIEKNPEILNYDESIQWMHIALHLDEVAFIKRFILDPRMQIHPTIIKRLIEIIKNADQVTLDIFLNQLFPADTFIRLFPIIAERAHLFAEAHTFEDRLFEVNNYKHLLNAAEQRLLEDLIHSISRFREAITLASSLLKNHVSFWVWGPSDNDSQKLLALFIAFNRSKVKDKFQQHFSKTSDFGALLKIAAKIKTKEMRDYSLDKSDGKNDLAYAFEIEEFITFVGPLISKNSKEYIRIINLAKQQAIAYTLTSFENLLHLTRASGIPGNLIAHRYRNSAQRNISISLIRSLFLLRERADDTAAIDKLVHLGLIANIFGKIKEAEKTQDLLLQLQKIYVPDEIQAKESKRNKALIDLSKTQIKKYDDLVVRSVAQETDLSASLPKRLRYDLNDGNFYPDAFDGNGIINLPIVDSTGDENSGASSSASYMPPMLDPDSESSEDSKPEKMTLDKYREGIQKLKQKYGEQKVDEIIDILKIKESKIENSNGLLEAIEDYINLIEKINSNPRWEKFKFDAAHSGRVTRGSLDEARTAIAAEEQDFLNNLKRSLHAAEEFIAENGAEYDVKTAYSKDFYKKKDIFDLEKFYEKMIESYHEKEHVMLDVSYLDEKNKADLLTKLFESLTPDQKSKTLIINVFDKTQSRWMN